MSLFGKCFFLSLLDVRYEIIVSKCELLVSESRVIIIILIF